MMVNYQCTYTYFWWHIDVSFEEGGHWLGDGLRGQFGWLTATASVV